MTDRVRPYTYYDIAVSICSTCHRRVDGKIVFQDDKVLLLKDCPEHGPERVLVADDIDYYRRAREVYIKPPEMPLKYNTPTRWGCPYDCGLCPDHEQHSCLSLIEITDACNLRCPVCYADSSPERQEYRSLAEVEAMLDAVVRNEGEPDVVQISGGEPTIHPDFFAILDAARARPIKHLMINTNGVRIAKDPEFVARLATYMPGFEVYLQFDSLQPDALRDLRGVDLADVRRKALENLEAHGINTNLVVVVKKGLNDHELGAIIDHALSWKCVRGVTFQPIQDAGRLDDYDISRDRLTLTEVRRRILEQSEVFSPDDIIPVPCHPDCLAMAYALRAGDKTVPLTGLIGPEALLAGRRNTIVYEHEPEVREAVFRLFATNHGPEGGVQKLKELLCCLPQADVPGLGYKDLFRVIIMEFIDAHGFDVRSVKKSCVSIVHPVDGRLIPFDTYNLFYRGKLEAEHLAPLRAHAEAARAPLRRAV